MYLTTQYYKLVTRVKSIEIIRSDVRNELLGPRDCNFHPF